jgi:hypothetical protein
VRKAKIVAVGVEEMHAGSEIAQFYREHDVKGANIGVAALAGFGCEDRRPDGKRLLATKS